MYAAPDTPHMAFAAGIDVCGGPAIHERRASVWRWALQAVLLAILLAVGALIAPARFGGSMTYAVVIGHSMEPVMHDGALAVAREREGYHLGQTVIYERYGGVVMHRCL